MRLLICGDRNWNNRAAIHREVLTNLDQIEVIIEGEARGADTLARLVAEELGIPVLRFPAQWEKYGRAAGPVRNKQMLDEGRPTQCFAFHTDIDNSKGTRDMVKRCRVTGVPVTVFAG